MRLRVKAIGVLFGLLLPLEVGHAATALLTAREKIDQAVAVGMISHEQGVLYKVYSIRAPEKLPAEYRPDFGRLERCATPMLREAFRELPQFSPSIQAAIRGVMARPTRAFQYDSPSGYFKIHYDTLGTNAVPTADGNANGIPDYVEKLGEYADSSWAHQVVTLGWRPPPPDNGNGGDDRFDIYTESMYYYGYTQPENPGPAPWNDFTSYISVHNNFIGFPPNNDPEGNPAGAAKVTVAHEFNHGCQMADNLYGEDFFYELTATYMEEETFDVVDDNYNYLSDFFNAPYISLKENSSHAYSTFIFGSFLAQTFDSWLMPQIWEFMRYRTVMQAVDSGLIVRGSSFAAQFPVFTGWNYLTNFRDDGFHYREGSQYPYLNVNFTESAYPITRSQTSSAKPQGWAANYIRFNPGTAPKKILRIDFNGSNGLPWAFSAIIHRPSGKCDILVAQVDLSTGDGTICVPFFPDERDYIVGVPTNLNSSTNGGSYQYTAALYTPGDVNEDGNRTPVDVVLLLDFVYKQSQVLRPADCFGDCNCDGHINPLDVVVLVNYVYRQGPAPCTP